MPQNVIYKILIFTTGSSLAGVPGVVNLCQVNQVVDMHSDCSIYEVSSNSTSFSVSLSLLMYFQVAICILWVQDELSKC